MATETKTTEIQEYTVTEAALATLAEKYRDAKYDCDSAPGMADAKSARDELRRYRLDLDKLRKDLKEPALRRCQLIDSEAKRISTALSALEDPIAEQIDEVAKRAQREEAARIQRVEDERLAAEKAARDAEDRRMAEERARLDADRKLLEEQQRESRERIEAEEKAAREKREAEEAARREELRKEEEARRVAEEAERQKRAEIEAEEKRLREERESIEREKRRIAQEGLDADAALVSFKSKFGHLPKYAQVVEAITALGIEG